MKKSSNNKANHETSDLLVVFVLFFFLKFDKSN